MEITLEESTTDEISPILEEIIKKVSIPHRSPDSIQKDYILILLIVSMIENGFVLVDDDCEIISYSSVNAEQISRWKSPTGVYEVSLIMNGFKNTPVKLIMSPLGAMALINVVIKDFEAETYSVCLPMSKYVVSPQAPSVPMIFRDLKHFSMAFKSKVLSAVKSRILDHYGYISASLVGLPEELLFKILLKLPVKDVINVTLTCIRLKEAVQSQRFWHDMVRRDFNHDNNLSTLDEHDWKAVYRVSYIARRETDLKRQKEQARRLNPYNMEYSNVSYNIDNPMWNALF